MALVVAAAAVACPAPFAALLAFAVVDEVATAAAALAPTFSTVGVWAGDALDVTVRPRSANLC